MSDQASQSGNVSVPRATVQRVLDDAAYISQVDRQALHAILAKPAAPIEQPREIPVAGGEVEVLAACKILEDCDEYSLRHHMDEVFTVIDAVKRLYPLYEDANREMHHWQRQAESIGLLNKRTEGERDALQVDLSKARECNKELAAMLLKVRDSEVHEGRLLYDSITKLVAHQSAPAAHGFDCHGPYTTKAVPAAKPDSWPCWSCKAPVTMADRADADGSCPHCEAELDLEDWPAPAAKGDPECTSCDGSGEYIDSLGDWRGYCRCPAGIAAKGDKS
ncbi:hypothetical protein [Pseudomonas sp. CCC4.4]|uniref:hypothetical protein n=1 Tax=Pseudomonas sp. CCC4.4 TaxID=3048612 RepID=UPI002B236165|nr:hypothetical protein [Pseudomonas sp. CCC4.4]MEB0170067.1 hypothetical protein [Pseudomonas sp. CCC4.4]